jgi:hypothetical protein
MQSHEYAIIGRNRTHVGRYLSVIAAAIAAAAYLAAGVVFKLAEANQLPIPNIVFWPLSAGAVYMVVHALFDKWLWKCRMARKIIDVPDVAGIWHCEGKTKDADGNTVYEWQATVSIMQSWEKIAVRMKTEQSSSTSMVAALINEGSQGYRLIYRYTNEPKAGEPLNSHVGFCDLRFNRDLTEAEGDYFNKGRWTFGQMRLTKEKTNGN